MFFKSSLFFGSCNESETSIQVTDLENREKFNVTYLSLKKWSTT